MGFESPPIADQVTGAGASPPAASPTKNDTDPPAPSTITASFTGVSQSVSVRQVAFSSGPPPHVPTAVPVNRQVLLSQESPMWLLSASAWSEFAIQGQLSSLGGVANRS